MTLLSSECHRVPRDLSPAPDPQSTVLSWAVFSAQYHTVQAPGHHGLACPGVCVPRQSRGVQSMGAPDGVSPFYSPSVWLCLGSQLLQTELPSSVVLQLSMSGWGCTAGEHAPGPGPTAPA